MTMLENFLAIAEIDGVLLGSDWGSQADLLMSFDTWQQMIQPGEQREYDLIHAYGKDVGSTPRQHHPADPNIVHHEPCPVLNLARVFCFAQLDHPKCRIFTARRAAHKSVAPRVGDKNNGNPMAPKPKQPGQYQFPVVGDSFSLIPLNRQERLSRIRISTFWRKQCSASAS